MSSQGVSPSGHKTGLDLDPLLDQLGNRGRYQVTQLILNIFASFLFAVPGLDIVFTGYKPDYRCSQVHNVTYLEDFLPNDVTNFTLHDVQYQQCSIDVTVNTSGTSSTHSLPCVAGVNFSLPSDTSFVTEWSLVCDKAGLTQLTQTGVFGGQVAGYLVFSGLADRFGRKKVYVSCMFCTLAMVIATPLVPSYYLFLACRIIIGFFVVGTVHPAYTMFLELLPQHRRFMASVSDTFMWTLACLFMATVAYCLQGISWRYLSLALSSVFIYALILPWFLDESLRWLIATGRMDEAEKILKKACRINGKDFGQIQALLYDQFFTNHIAKNSFGDQVLVDSTKKNEDEVVNKTEVTSENAKEEVTDEVKLDQKATEQANDDIINKTGTGDNHDLATEGNERSSNDPLRPGDEVVYPKYTVLDLFRHRVVLVPFLVCSFVWMTSNLYYYALLLGSANLSGNRFLNFGLLNLQDIPSVLVALFLVRRFNRRPLAFFYGTVAASFLLISVGLVALGGGKEITLTLGTVAQYIGKFSLTGSYILLFVYYMEVFPTAMRAVGTGTVGLVIRMTDMGAPFLLLWAEETPWAPGVLLGCLCCLASLSIWLLPETRHRKLPDTIEEIQAWGKTLTTFTALRRGDKTALG